MNPYVDGYLLAVPANRLERYKEMAAQAGAIWKEYGALEFRECVGDSLDHEHEMRNFREVAQAGPDDVVVFSWITFRDKAERDRINAAVMQDPRLANFCGEGVFNPKQMAWGGFTTLVGA